MMKKSARLLILSCLLLLSHPCFANQSSTADVSGTITAGGTAQYLYSAKIPKYGYGIYNPDASNDLWISTSGTAVANGTGSIRIPANGGGYECPSNAFPDGPISIVGANTGQKFTAKVW